MWKKVTYVGWGFNTLDSLKNLITDNKLTHILFEFVVFGSSTYDTSGKRVGVDYKEFKTRDAATSWVNLLEEDKLAILNLCDENNVTIGFSVGGATSFYDPEGDDMDAFCKTWLYEESTYYIGKFNNDLKSSAMQFANDLVVLMNNNKLDYIDLDIEHIPSKQYYMDKFPERNYEEISDYLGYVSEYINKYFYENNKYYPTVSHAPQTPYFSTSSSTSRWPNVYNIINDRYGTYIDFYSIQYYNNGAVTEDTLFENDTINESSIKQLVERGFPANKIVMGAAVDSGIGLCQNGTSVGPTWDELTTMINKQINTDWYNKGGVMTWLYILDGINGNSNVTNFWKDTNH